MIDSLTKYQNKPVKEHPNKVSGNPVVSVCVITYQHVGYIQQCLEGILKQKTSFSFEIIIGEDESNDGTREICIEYAKKYPDKIRLFLHSRQNVIPVNGRPSGRFNYLWNLAHAKGKYIAVIDGDDYWDNPYKLEKQVNCLEKNCSISLCFTDFSIVNETGVCLKNSGVPAKHKKEVFDYLRILEYYTPKVLTVLFRKTALPKILPKEIFEVTNVDVFIFSLITQKSPAGYLDINSGCYRMNKNSLWSMKSRLLRTEITLATFTKMREYYTAPEEVNAINARLSRNKIIQAIIYIKKGKVFKAIVLLKKSIQLSTKPFHDLVHLFFQSG